ncbi:MAG: disulfide bond formation protein B [Acidimicrobiia bacterium]|nr:disulfide bond formation protein B [Acidimicrobiia bacterium]
MDVLFAVLAFVAIVVGLAYGFLSRSPQRPALVSAALPVAASIATVSMLGSLYYSEIRGFTPCELCWYQRIAMYSLAVILVIAVLRRDTQIAPYAATLSFIGFGISTYHYYVQMFGGGDSCGLDASCAVRWVDTFGIVSIPFMAGAGFFGVAGSMFYLLKARTR